MTPGEFREWRKAHFQTQAEAAEALGLAKRTIVYYEAGERHGRPVEIPRVVELACAALADPFRIEKSSA